MVSPATTIYINAENSILKCDFASARKRTW